MALFVPDTVRFQDPVGWGHWRTRHTAEHDQLNAALGNVLPSIDLMSWRDDPDFIKLWLNDHYAKAHLPLRKLTGISSEEDLSAVKWDDPDAFYDWLDIHADEHAQLRAALGIN